MTLQERLMEDMKTAMRAKDSDRLTVIRMLRSEVKNHEIDNGPADDKTVETIVKRMMNQQLDAMNDFKNADRQDLVAETQIKIDVLKVYLPQQMTDEALQELVNKVVAEASNKDFGPLMGQVMKQAGNAADGGRVSAMLKQILAK